MVIIGTKGCYGFHRGGVDKLTYNHFDSYPEGLGADIVEFVRQTSVEEMNQIFDRIQMVNEDKMATPDQVAECHKWYSGAVSTGQPTEWYALIAAWFAFTTGELFMLSGIKKTEIKENGYEDHSGSNFY